MDRKYRNKQPVIDCITQGQTTSVGTRCQNTVKLEESYGNCGDSFLAHPFPKMLHFPLHLQQCCFKASPTSSVSHPPSSSSSLAQGLNEPPKSNTTLLHLHWWISVIQLKKRDSIFFPFFERKNLSLTSEFGKQMCYNTYI